MSAFKRILVFIIWCGSLNTTIAQIDSCAIELEIPIAAMDTTLLNIDISGLINDQLGNNNNLCGVELHFEHARLENLRIELISPNGTIVNLVGPATLSANPTQLMDWEVTFIPCSFVADPDSSFPDVWTNQNPWMIFNTYSGRYHPAMGCLEDYNGGSANGLWQLRLIDLGQFGNGVLKYVKLIFCDEEGIDCSPCFIYAGNPENQSLSFCNAQAGLDMVEINLLTAPAIDSLTQSLNYLISQNDIIISTEETLNLEAVAAGTYQICLLAIDDADLALIPSSLSSLQSMIMTNTLCADLSSNCVDLILYESQTLSLIEAQICKRDSFVFDGQSFTQAIDTIVYTLNNNICDGTHLMLMESDLTADFMVSGALDCTGQGIVLINALSSSSSTSSNLMYQWTTIDGNFVTDLGPIAQVDQNGTYVLTVDDGLCTDTLSLLIDSEQNSFTFDLSADTLGCDMLPSNIIVNTNANIDSFFWEGPGLLLPISLNPFVGQPGMYVLMLYSGPCLKIDSIEVIADNSTPMFDISYDTINCQNDFATATVITAIQNYSFEIDPNFGVSQNNNVLTLIEGGLYNLTLTDLANNCTAVQSFNIVIDTISPLNSPIGIIAIPCNIDSVNVSPVNIEDSITYQWFDESGFLLSTEFSLMVADPQDLNLSLLDTTNFCESQQIVVVVKDVLDINPVLSANNISCDNLNPIICSSETGDQYNYAWSFQNNEIGNAFCVAAVAEGFYTLEITDSDNCSYLDSIEILADNSIPFIDLESQLSFTCGLLQFGFTAGGSDEGDPFIINWQSDSGEGIVFQSGVEVVVDQPGIYTIEITNSDNNCSNSQDIEIIPALDYNLELAQANCIGQTGGFSISVETVASNYSVLINGQTLFTNDTILNIGTYDLEINDSNGCQINQSIEIESNSSTILNLIEEIQITQNESVQLIPVIDTILYPIQNISWSPSTGLSCNNCLFPIANPTESTNYFLDIELQDGCVLSSQIFVEVLQTSQIYIPSIFSPNGDGFNDNFTLGSNIENQSFESFHIYDRWGNLIFNVENSAIDNSNAQWDGRYGASKLDTGVYVYKIVFNHNGEKIIRKGNLTLIR